jgi:hypothetical protein
VRAAPSTAARRVGFLPQFTAGQADQTSTDASGAYWYRVSVPGLTGWILGELLVDEPAYYWRFGSSWSLVYPNANASSGGVLQGEFVEVGSFIDTSFWWALQIRSAPDAASLPPPAANWFKMALAPELYDRSEQITVWKYTATKRVVRVWLNTYSASQLRMARNARCPYLAVVEFVTAAHAYQFQFLAADPDSPVVRKLIDSINISE